VVPLFQTWAKLLSPPLAVIVVRRARHEERALVAELGAEWEEYGRRVSAGVVGC
jgi:protein-S-isoprenylcysteine O-methyltransferase Ste14